MVHHRDARNFLVILPASGSSNRMALAPADKSKLFLKLNDDCSVLEHSLQTVFDSGIRTIIIPTTAELIEDIRLVGEKIGKWDNLVVIEGGQTRFHSVFNALKVVHEDILKKANFDFVFIHDAARPNCPVSLFSKMVQIASFDNALIPALPVVNTIKAVDSSGLVKSTLNRDELYEIQTPQLFPLKGLFEIYLSASQSGTLEAIFDDAAVYEKFGKSVRIIEGCKKNSKITYPEDIALANFNNN